MNSIERLREYVENDKIYQEYKKSNKKPSDFERFCFTHCRDIENVLDALDEIREYIDKEFYTIQGVIVVEPDDIKDILDKVKEWVKKKDYN